MRQRVGVRAAEWCVAAALAAVAFGCAAPSAPAPPPAAADVTARMSGIVSALEVALPYAEDQETFASPTTRGEIAAALEQLRENASAIREHGGEDSPAFAFFSRRLVEDASDVEARFLAGSTDEARFLLQELSDDCVGCHVRLPDARPHPVGAPLAGGFADADPQTRVRLQMATRQFDAALGTYEAMFTSPEHPPAELDIEGALEGFLVVAIRVRGDLARAERGLAAVAARPSTPPYLAQLLATWRRALAELAPYATSQSLADAEKVLAQGDALRRFPADRAALVHDFVASGVLHRALAAGGLTPNDSARASYLLGIAELRSDPSRRVPQAEWYLENAIRSAPGSEIAQDAYALLEEQAFLSFSGSGGTEIPDDVIEHLRALRALAEE
jgi:hypothetical protein